MMCTLHIFRGFRRSGNSLKAGTSLSEGYLTCRRFHLVKLVQEIKKTYPKARTGSLGLHRCPCDTGLDANAVLTYENPKLKAPNPP